MKKIGLSLFLLVVIFGIYNNANAIPYTWTDSITPNIQFSDGLDRYTFTYNLMNNGFDIGKDEVLSCQLSLNLRNGNGSYALVFTSLSWPTLVRVGNNTDVVLDFSSWGIATLNNTGEVTVNIIDLYGDFVFYGLTSTVVVDRPDPSSSPVPEPATIFLMGSGLLGVGVILRKKVKPKHE